MLQKVFKDNKVLISERNDNNLFAVFVWDFPHFVKARELYLFICPQERFACHVVSISEPRRLGSSV